MKNLSVLLLGLLLSVVSYAETLYVHSNKAVLLTDRDFSSGTVALLQKGDAVTVLQRQTRWVEVEFNAQQGWVSVLLLKATPPSSIVSVIGSDDVNLEGDARMRASAVATAGATRGLVEEGDSQSMGFDFNELQQLETMVITDQELEMFSQPVLGGGQ